MIQTAKLESAVFFATRARLLALEDSMDPAVAVGRQFADNRLDLGHQLVVRQRLAHQASADIDPSQCA